ncbi:MAG: OadG family protein [Elusimicrobiaceae bacterium]|nr:OadG family protein [Elusimicrobiaceae bacterium]
MSESLLGQSFSITVIGMSVVFVFLLILVGLMFAMSRLVRALEKYFPQAVAQTAHAGADNTLVAIAIAAAKRFQTK